MDERRMQHVELRDFREQPERYLRGGRELVIGDGAHTLGTFTPSRSALDPGFRESLAKLEETLARIREQTGMTEDELADLLDPSKPFPYDDVAAPEQSAMPVEHAAGR